ncbi:MAG: cyclic pyranopterin monophosphate synthase MoaC [Spirochaetes bacterium]|nr:cyclic pyranopterin monophosphate synthase MoaC [Spirochaetota bacterium]
MKDNFSHIDGSGNVRMVDVGDKKVTRRIAKASCTVLMDTSTLEAISENKIKKGNVLTAARIAGIFAAKKVDSLIPMCHTLPVDHIDIQFLTESDPGKLEIRSAVSVNARTGAEMEALQAVAQAALTVYDMCKSVDRGMIISDIRLMEKSGGKSGLWKRE